MLKKYITDNGRIHEINEYVPGNWIVLIKPDGEEVEEVARHYDIDISDIRAALDDEESSRIDVNDEYTMIVCDIPSVEIRHKQTVYTTIPLGIIWTESMIITVCSAESPILMQFINNMVKGFTTKKQVRFCYQLLYRNCMFYQSYLRVIDRQRVQMEEQISKHMEDIDIINLHELESTLVYFDTSLRANRIVLDKFSRYSKIKRYPEDQELLEDVIIENQQAIEMTQIYRDIVRGTRELMSSVLDNRMNNVMKYLASITLVMAVPTVISGLYGMNVDSRWMPLAHTAYGFEIICGIAFLICVILLIILRKRKML